MAKRKRRPVYGKLQKTWVLKRSKDLSSYAPPTRTFNRANLSTMVKRYSIVYVKPNYGCHGIGVMKVERLKRGQYRLKTGLITKEFGSFDSLYKYIVKNIDSKNYIIQKGIMLISYKSRPFDIRVMVQKSVSSKKWHVTGMAARVAAPKRVVTNFNKGRNGATIQTVERVLSSHFSRNTVARKKKMLHQLGLKVSRHFQKTYPGLKETGLDVVFDQKHKPWLLEVNTTYPSAYMFKFLKNKAMYYRMIRFKKTYRN